MRILVTNDDGVNAPGIEVLEAIARELTDDIWVVGPAEEQSGAGHSLTLADPVRIRQLSERRYALRGTPIAERPNLPHPGLKRARVTESDPGSIWPPAPKKG